MLLRGRRNGREGKWERESEQDEEFLAIGGARLATKHSTQMPHIAHDHRDGVKSDKESVHRPVKS